MVDDQFAKHFRNQYLQKIERIFSILKTIVITLLILLVCFQLLLQSDDIRAMIASAEREEGTAVH